MYINPKDSIKLSNVVSQKYEFHINDLKDTLNYFLKIVEKNKLAPKSLCLYSINNIPLDGMIQGEFFISVKNELIDRLDGLEYYSYFCIENMISTCMYENYEIKTEEAYFRLLKYIEENNMQQVTPIFNVFAGDTNFQYVYTKVGVMSEDDYKNYFN